jgi:hypothetical protein
VSPSTPRESRSGSAAKPKLPQERAHFKELLLANHFGTIADSPLPVKFTPAGDTSYEQLMCIGYHPESRRLDAVVHIKLDGGYNGGLCTAGSREYVKFFASTDGGTTWTELGTTSFNVWDVPGPKPLEYDATLPNVDLTEECCKEENLVLVRAILSWEVPPAGPDDPVVWGNALDATIQVEPLQTGTIIELFSCLDLTVAESELVSLVDAEQPITFGVDKKLTPLELHKAYHGTKVPQHRYLFPHVQELLAAPAALTDTLSQPGFELFPGLEKVDIAKLIDFIIDPQGDETFERLGCVGLNENTPELVATIDVKLSSGYSGGLCTNGSQEYVAFWVDWEDGNGWQYAGTTSVGVHDIGSIPNDGLQYSAALPFAQVYTHRQPCEDGPKEARVRAVLSWATPPSTTNPYAVPVWGGHEETRILLPPGQPVLGGGPLIEYVGSIYITDIQGSGLAKVGANSINGWSTANQAPFGARISIGGLIINPLSGLPGGPGYEYRILVSVGGGPWTPVTTQFTIGLENLQTATQTPITITPDPNGWCPYYENFYSPPYEHVVADVLGYWDSAGDGKAKFMVEARQGMISLGSTPSVTIQLDNTRPQDAIAITSGGGSCGDFKVGDTIVGSYWASDNEGLRALVFDVEPALGGGTFSTTPSITTLTFEDGTWQLNTTGMDPCGYVVHLEAYDRTIVDSSTPVGWSWPAFVGFCLKK